MASLMFVRCLKVFNIMRINCLSTQFLNRDKSEILRTVVQINTIKKRLLASDTNSKETETDSTLIKPKKKKKVGLRITLISVDSTMSVITLQEAEKISKRRNLKLVKVSDANSQSERPTYKFLAGDEYLEEEKRRRSERSKNRQDLTKNEKLVSIKSKISDNDLSYRINNINKLLKKKHEVVIVITKLNNEAASKKIFDTIKSNTKDYAREHDKIINNNVIKFTLEPLITEEDSNSLTDEEDSTEEKDKSIT